MEKELNPDFLNWLLEVLGPVLSFVFLLFRYVAIPLAQLYIENKKASQPKTPPAPTTPNDMTPTKKDLGKMGVLLALTFLFNGFVVIISHTVYTPATAPDTVQISNLDTTQKAAPFIERLITPPPIFKPEKHENH